MRDLEAVALREVDEMELRRTVWQLCLRPRRRNFRSQFEKADEIAGNFVALDEAEGLAQSMDIDEISAVAAAREHEMRKANYLI